MSDQEARSAAQGRDDSATPYFGGGVLGPPIGPQQYGPDDDAVLGYCPHGVNLDRDFCPEGCRV